MKRIGELLSSLSGRLELGAGQARQQILGRWEELMGDQIGQLARPAGFRKSVLILHTGHPAAAMEIRLRKREILDRLNEAAGKVLFESLRVTCKSTGGKPSER